MSKVAAKTQCNAGQQAGKRLIPPDPINEGVAIELALQLAAFAADLHFQAE
ncbi:hypothetical protein GVN24_15950 [Rhizobium sp. CRIBSB]|nr:hypothetical protein [Rhizobium sp. CRIBSB]